MRSFSQLSGGMSGLCHCYCHPISKGRVGASACSVAHGRSLDKSNACARQSRCTRWRTQALCDPAPVARHRWRCRAAQQEWLSSMALRVVSRSSAYVSDQFNSSNLIRTRGGCQKTPVVKLRNIKHRAQQPEPHTRSVPAGDPTRAPWQRGQSAAG